MSFAFGHVQPAARLACLSVALYLYMTAGDIRLRLITLQAMLAEEQRAAK